MTEAGYTTAIGKKLPQGIYTWKIADRYTAGIPDAWYSGDRDIWVEYKYAHKLPKKSRPKLSELQRRWLNDRHAQGRNVAVIVGSPDGAIILTDGAWNERSDWTNLISREEVVEWIVHQTTSAQA